MDRGPSQPRRPAPWTVAGGAVPLDSPTVMGVLNLTPDSFSDGGEVPDPRQALARARRMVGEGAGILDVGGESTRPGADAVDEEEELRRVVPTIELLATELDVPISVDTRKAEVARQALAAGARIVNDVSGLSFDREMAAVVRDAGAGLILMHMRGTPADMRTRTDYDDVVGEVADELERSVDRARTAGVEESCIVLDPGIGFAKTAFQSFTLIRELTRLRGMGFPVMVGPSRKSFLGELLGVPPSERVTATAVVCALAWERGASLFRVHDVRPVVDALMTAQAVAGDPGPRVGVVNWGRARADEDAADTGGDIHR
jgi:dihydropteroate synthase